MMAKHLRQRPLIWLWIGLLTVLLVVSSAIAAQARNHGSIHLIMGTPSPATWNAANANDYLMVRWDQSLSYNNQKGIANWVSWQLNSTWFNDVERCSGEFMTDPTLPRQFRTIRPSDYAGSGFVLGRMTPPGDRATTLNPGICGLLSLTTNVVPQTQDLQTGPWLQFEQYCRELAKQGKNLYITAGPYGQGGTGSKGFARTIGKGKVVVPTSLWKIVVVLDELGQGVREVTEKTRVIAINIPNTVGIPKRSYQDYLTTVDELEKLTGYNFLSDVPEAIQAVIEAKKDTL